MNAQELTKPAMLCLNNGTLNPESVGWSRTPLITSNIKGDFLRRKKWNYWCITSDAALFSATISHIDYAASLFVYFYDRLTGEFQEKTVTVPFGIGVNMPEEVRESVFYDGRQLTIRMIEKPDTTELFVNAKDFGGKPLDAFLEIKRPEDQESLNVVIPWVATRFQYTAKQPALPAFGTVEWGGYRYHFDHRNHSFACLDFGRGKWPYSSEWNWGSASGKDTSGRTVGLNLGGKWTDETGQNENGVLIDGKLVKIHEDLEWQYDQADLMAPWTMSSRGSDTVKLTFHPTFERLAETNLGVIKSKVNQMFGTYEGMIHTEEYGDVEVKELFGWVEDHEAKW
ncbi:DUF2804 domain-containing protein [Salisediminibacterium beveridgei]|uniref:DUF2804 domain-containing protein n=1 Tax=Salisediminibacterium beveridgei TaxID=632773 RepID=A0A1D7QZ13_9BACI|nr:DUF2804 domain-containing protein [Salisediminibacterium beveridgei]AOM84257.1 hypothetical protein BBEV_2932 [Salisediminibacterium beveridgei]